MDGDMNQSLYTKVANPETLTDVWKAHYVNELREKCKAFIAATEPESSWHWFRRVNRFGTPFIDRAGCHRQGRWYRDVPPVCWCSCHFFSGIRQTDLSPNRSAGHIDCYFQGPRFSLFSWTTVLEESVDNFQRVCCFKFQFEIFARLLNRFGLRNCRRPKSPLRKSFRQYVRQNSLT